MQPERAEDPVEPGLRSQRVEPRIDGEEGQLPAELPPGGFLDQPQGPLLVSQAQGRDCQADGSLAGKRRPPLRHPIPERPQALEASGGERRTAPAPGKIEERVRLRQRDPGPAGGEGGLDEDLAGPGIPGLEGQRPPREVERLVMAARQERVPGEVGDRHPGLRIEELRPPGGRERFAESSVRRVERGMDAVDLRIARIAVERPVHLGLGQPPVETEVEADVDQDEPRLVEARREGQRPPGRGAGRRGHLLRRPAEVEPQPGVDPVGRCEIGCQPHRILKERQRPFPVARLAAPGEEAPLRKGLKGGTAQGRAGRPQLRMHGEQHRGEHQTGRGPPGGSVSRPGADRNEKPVAPARQGLQIDRVGRRVSQGNPDPADREVEPLLELDEGVLAPEMALDLLAGDDLAGAPREQLQQPGRLRLERDPHAVPEQLAAVRPQLVRAEEQAGAFRVLHPCFYAGGRLRFPLIGSPSQEECDDQRL